MCVSQAKAQYLAKYLFRAIFKRLTQPQIHECENIFLVPTIQSGRGNKKNMKYGEFDVRCQTVLLNLPQSLCHYCNYWEPKPVFVTLKL